MDFLNVPSFYFSPQIVLVDDDTDLLCVLQDALGEFFDVEIFYNPKVFLKEIHIHPKIMDILCQTRELTEDSSRLQPVVQLNYTDVVMYLNRLVMQDGLSSLVFIDDFMPEMDGVSCCQLLDGEHMCRVLLTSSLTDQEILCAFNKKLIQQYLSKDTDNLVDEMIKMVNNNHLDVVFRLNDIFFGDFYKTSVYGKLFSDKRFVVWYQTIIENYFIKFACVYDASGSMVLEDKSENFFHINIYTQTEIENILFESIEFERDLSVDAQNLCKEFKVLVDYRAYRSENFLVDQLSNTLTDDFYSLSIDEEVYYVVFR